MPCRTRIGYDRRMCNGHNSFCGVLICLCLAATFSRNHGYRFSLKFSHHLMSQTRGARNHEDQSPGAESGIRCRTQWGAQFLSPSGEMAGWLLVNGTSELQPQPQKAVRCAMCRSGRSHMASCLLRNQLCNSTNTSMTQPWKGSRTDKAARLSLEGLRVFRVLVPCRGPLLHQAEFHSEGQETACFIQS